MKVKNIIRDIIFISIGILIMVFRDPLLEHINLLVGITMIIYSINELIDEIITKKIFTKVSEIAPIFTQAILGIATIILGKNNIDTVCIIWGCWAVLREAQEIQDKVIERWDNRVIAIFNLVESIILMVLSFILIKELREGAPTHIFILSLEYILEIFWARADEFATNKKISKKLLN